MQIAAMNPVALDKDDVDQKTLDREIEIGKEQARAEGKPENLIEKIVNQDIEDQCGLQDDRAVTLEAKYHEPTEYLTVPNAFRVPVILSAHTLQASVSTENQYYFELKLKPEHYYFEDPYTGTKDSYSLQPTFKVACKKGKMVDR